MGDIHKMKEAEEIILTDLTNKNAPLHKQIWSLWWTGFISGCVGMISLYLFINGHWILGLGAFIISCAGRPQRDNRVNKK